MKLRLDAQARIALYCATLFIAGRETERWLPLWPGLLVGLIICCFVASRLTKAITALRYLADYVEECAKEDGWDDVLPEIREYTEARRIGK